MGNSNPVRGKGREMHSMLITAVGFMSVVNLTLSASVFWLEFKLNAISKAGVKHSSGRKGVRILEMKSDADFQDYVHIAQLKEGLRKWLLPAALGLLVCVGLLWINR